MASRFHTLELASIDRRAWAIAALLFALSLSMSAYDIGYPPAYVWDEHVYIPGALAAARGEAFAFDGAAHLPRFGTGRASWMHPPLGKYAMALASEALGDPFGARYASAIAGGVAIAALFLIALELGLPVFYALLASALFLLDGERYVFSRIAMLESLLVCFTLCAAFAFVRALRGPHPYRWLAAFGVLGGCAIGTKWSGAAILGCAALVWARRTQMRTQGTESETSSWPRELALSVLTLVAIPAAVFTALYAPYVFEFSSSVSHRSLGEIWGAMYEAQTRYRKGIDDQLSLWWWPLLPRPSTLAIDATSPGRAIQIVPSALVWWATVPAAIYALTRRRLDVGFVGACVLAFWLPWALVSRTTYPYYFLPAIPFGCCCIALVIRALPDRVAPAIAAITLVICAGWFAWFSPSYFGTTPIRGGPFEVPHGNPTRWHD